MRFEIKKDLKQPAADKERLSSTAWLKIGLICLITIFVAVGLWLSYASVLKTDLTKGNASLDIWLIIRTYGLFVIAMAGMAIISLLVQPRRIGLACLGLFALTPLIVFPLTPLTFAAAALLLIGSLQFDAHVRHEVARRIRFAPVRSTHFGLGLLVALILMAAALLAYVSADKTLRERSTTSTGAVINLTSQLANQWLPSQLPDYNPNEKFSDFFTRNFLKVVAYTPGNQPAVAGQLSLPEMPGTFNPKEMIPVVSPEDADKLMSQLPPDVREEIGTDPAKFKAVLEEPRWADFRREYESYQDQVLPKLSLEANGQTPLSEVVQLFIAKTLAPKIERYEDSILPIFSLSIYLILQLFAFIHIFFITALISACVGLLRLTRVVKIKAVQADVQVATLGETPRH